MTNRLPTNGTPAPIPAVDLVGGVNLGASVLRDKVKGVLEARMDQPMGLAPTFRESVGIAKPQGFEFTASDVDFTRATYEQKYWAIVARLRVLGVSEKDGDFTLIEIGYGQNQQGNLFAEFVLQWAPREVGVTKPTLVAP